MLSVLIPIYNYNPEKLILSLSQEINTHSLPVEIVGMDDGSNSYYYPFLDYLEANSSICLIRLQKNIGRPAIRNLLSKEAKFEHLLFLDNDGLPQYDDFLRKYLQSIKSHPNAIILGGRTYFQQAPEDRSYLLHWKYGQNRESTSAHKRAQNPYYGFQSNNFVIPQAIFKEFQFDENVHFYGHEDTLFGLKAQLQNISLIHIDNPAIHTGLEEKNIFLDKTAYACSNAVFIYHDTGLKVGRAIRVALNLKSLNLANMVRWTIGMALPTIRKNLLGTNPSLLGLDLYKLHLMLTMISKKEKSNIA